MVGGYGAALAAGSSIATRLETHRRKEYPGSKAVLVAIAIPVFTAQLEKSKEATDQANIRSAYAEVMTAALTDTGLTTEATANVTRTGSADGSFVWTATVDLKQARDGWQGAADEIGGIDVSTKTPKAGGTCTITYTQSTDITAITFSS